MKALIVGGSGQVGTALGAVLEERGHEVIRTYHQHEIPGAIRFDITKDRAKDILKTAMPQVVFCPAGATHVEKCEVDPEYSYLLNVQGPVVLAKAAVPFGARFIYFSSEYVFGEGQGPFSESDEAKPKNVYGYHKFETEKLLQDISGSSVIRTTVVYGEDPQKQNTIYQLLRALKAGESFRAASDQITTPTFNLDLAEAAVLLAERGASGIFHAAGPQRMSRFDFAVEACNVFGFDSQKIIPVKTSDLGLKAARPLEAGLDSNKLYEDHDMNLRAPAEGLPKMKALLAD